MSPLLVVTHAPFLTQPSPPGPDLGESCQFSHSPANPDSPLRKTFFPFAGSLGASYEWGVPPQEAELFGPPATSTLALRNPLPTHTAHSNTGGPRGRVCWMAQFSLVLLSFPSDCVGGLPILLAYGIEVRLGLTRLEDRHSKEEERQSRSLAPPEDRPLASSSDHERSAAMKILQDAFLSTTRQS